MSQHPKNKQPKIQKLLSNKNIPRRWLETNTVKVGRKKVRVNGFARYEKNTVTETKDTIKRSYVEKEG